jgi:hypothetical protein
LRGANDFYDWRKYAIAEGKVALPIWHEMSRQGLPIGDRRSLQLLISLIEQTVYFLDKHKEFLGVLLDCSKGTEVNHMVIDCTIHMQPRFSGDVLDGQGRTELSVSMSASASSANMRQLCLGTIHLNSPQ